MKIAISQRESRNAHGDWIDSLEHQYLSYFNRFTEDITLIPNNLDVARKLISNVKFDLVILTGGGAVDPNLYSDQSINFDGMNRDKVEYELINYCIEKNIKLLAICRGMQLTNVYFGGSLLKSIKNIDKNHTHEIAKDHELTLVSKPLIDFFQFNTCTINNYHDEGILKSQLSSDLVALGIFEPLNLIESYYHKTYHILGIQWHPERFKTEHKFTDKLIEHFITLNEFWR